MSVKDKVLIDIGDYQLFELDVLFDMSLNVAHEGSKAGVPVEPCD